MFKKNKFPLIWIPYISKHKPDYLADQMRELKLFANSKFMQKLGKESVCASATLQHKLS